MKDNRRCIAISLPTSIWEPLFRGHWSEFGKCLKGALHLSTSMINYEILTALEICNYKLVVVLSLAQHISKTTAEPKRGRLRVCSDGLQMKTLSYSNLKLFDTVASGLQAKFNAPRPNWDLALAGDNGVQSQMHGSQKYHNLEILNHDNKFSRFPREIRKSKLSTHSFDSDEEFYCERKYKRCSLLRIPASFAKNHYSPHSILINN